MAKKRVYEIAKEKGLSSKDLVSILQAAGLDVKAAASSVDEATVLKVLSENGAPDGRASAPAPNGPAAAAPKTSAAASAAPPKAAAQPKTAPQATEKIPEKAAAKAAAAAPPQVAASPATAQPSSAPPPAGGGPSRKAPGQSGGQAGGSGGARTGGGSGPRQGGGSGPRQGGGRQGGAPAGSRQGGGTQRPGTASRRRRVVIDSQASRRQVPPPMQQQRRRRSRGRGAPPPEPVEGGNTPAVEREAVKIPSGATVRDVAEHLGVQVSDIIKKLMGLGEMASITQTLSDEAIGILAEEFDRKVEIVRAADDPTAEPVFDDSEADLIPRPPVVAIMGHVDHGKTSLLDAIRETEVVAGEAGGITQHIGAYQVHHDDKVVTFLDTPGHEAFTAMRARGAKVTDIAVIVVAADDGVMPQTTEAIDHAKAAGVPMVIAVNKIDKPEADPNRVRGDLATQGLTPEDWGGETIYCDVSAKARQGLDNLLDMILLQAEVEELRANKSAPASGTVVESRLDPGRGPVVTVLVQRGTLNIGDAVVAGGHWGRVRAMHDYMGQRVKHVLPGEPVEILGFDSVPDAGEAVRAVESDKDARRMAGDRANRLKTEALARRRGAAVSLEDVFERVQQGQAVDLNLVLKADVNGSLEAIQDQIAKLSHAEVALRVLHTGVGGISKSDVMLAAASGAVIIGFNVRPLPEARVIADQEGVDIRSYSVIYKITDELKAAMQGMLAPEEVEDSVGMVEVRQTFRASKIGIIAGCYVTQGRVQRGSKVRVVRDGTVVHDGRIGSLRRFKDDVREVEEGFECGVVMESFQDVREGDVLEAYETRQVERELE